MVATAQSSIVLPAIIDLDALDIVRDKLIDAIEHGPVVVNGMGVERVSTNALLMFLSAADTARRNNFSFSIADASMPMVSAIERLGLAGQFSGMMKG